MMLCLRLNSIKKIILKFFYFQSFGLVFKTTEIKINAGPSFRTVNKIINFKGGY